MKSPWAGQAGCASWVSGLHGEGQPRAGRGNGAFWVPGRPVGPAGRGSQAELCSHKQLPRGERGHRRLLTCRAGGRAGLCFCCHAEGIWTPGKEMGDRERDAVLMLPRLPPCPRDSQPGMEGPQAAHLPWTPGPKGPEEHTLVGSSVGEESALQGPGTLQLRRLDSQGRAASWAFAWTLILPHLPSFCPSPTHPAGWRPPSPSEAHTWPCQAHASPQAQQAGGQWRFCSRHPQKAPRWD